MGGEYSWFSEGRETVYVTDQRWTGGNRGLAFLQDAIHVSCVTIIGWKGLTTEGIRALQACESLRSVHLHGVDEDDTHLREIGKISQLSELEVGGPYITDAGIEHLAALPNLTRLALNVAPKITGNSLKCLASCPRLVALTLDHDTGISDRDVAYLEQLGQLQELTLQGNFTPAAIDHLVRLKQLKHLTFTAVSPTPIPEDDWKRLKSGLPECEIP